MLPAGIFQGLVFDKQRPQYMNYGAIGWFLGHEITHGFYDKGSTYDADGNNVDWWELETKEKFSENVDCIIQQYSNYTVEEVGLNVSIIRI